MSVSLTPELYGNTEQFPKFTKTAVRGGVDLLNDCEECKKTADGARDYGQCFFHLLDHLASERAFFAKSSKTPHFEDFGAPRYNAEKQQVSKLMTPLAGPQYEAYGNKMIEYFQSLLKTMDYTAQGFAETKKTFDFPEVLGRKSRINVEIFNRENLSKWTIPQDDTGIRKWNEIGKAVGLKQVHSKSDLGHFFQELNQVFLTPGNMERLAKLKKLHPEYYKILKVNSLVNKLQEKFPQAEMTSQTSYIYVTYRVEVQGKFVALSNYMTWTNVTGREDPVDAMKGRSAPILEHLDPLLIPVLLEDISLVFKKVMEQGQNESSSDRAQEILIQYLFFPLHYI
ncbi:hypothetical protein [Simkania sp.]|uniref:hypothetical protein n=1 Tax=Simkania sp. TaxID=34094 RepID=UPI003B52BD85